MIGVIAHVADICLIVYIWADAEIGKTQRGGKIIYVALITTARRLVVTNASDSSGKLSVNAT